MVNNNAEIGVMPTREEENIYTSTHFKIKPNTFVSVLLPSSELSCLEILTIKFFLIVLYFGVLLLEIVSARYR